MVAAAAAAYPAVERDGFRLAWQRHTGGIVAESADAVEGPHPRLHIGPGMLRLSRIDYSRALRTRDRQRDLPTIERQLADARGETREEFLERGTPTRGLVAGWSKKSRRALMRTIATLDLRAVVGGVTPPAMVTLTLPGDWQAVCADGEQAADLFDRWTRAYRSRWGVEVACIWKREFQRRGAPHWHLWMALPTADESEFVEWLARSWAAVVAASVLVDENRTHVVGQENRHGVPICSCSERCRHIAAGTGVDIDEGRRARDPRRLMTYFLKESASLGAKAYQNAPPAAWEGGVVGRYWGVRNIPTAEAIVPIAPEHAARIWRALERARARRAPERWMRVEPIDPETGEVRRSRGVRRRVRTFPTTAGWLAVNDGPALAYRLASLLPQPST